MIAIFSEGYKTSDTNDMNLVGNIPPIGNCANRNAFNCSVVFCMNESCKESDVL